MSETPTEVPNDKLQATSNVPAPAPIKRFSDFEDGMLDGVRRMNRDEDYRREVAKRIS